VAVELQNLERMLEVHDNPAPVEDRMKFGLIISNNTRLVYRWSSAREHIEQVRAARDAGFDLIVMGPTLSQRFQEIQTLPALAPGG
jgi:hypothetical protein